MGKNILWVTIFANAGGGYRVISAPICESLVEAGHTVKMLALDNGGEEHHFNFSIIPMPNFMDVQVAIHNLKSMWGIDLIVCAGDVPMCQMLLSLKAVTDIPVILITPLENGPLIRSVAADLMKAKKIFFISQLAVKEAAKVGLEAEFLPVAPDPIFEPASSEMRAAAKKALGFADTDKIVLTVAENQERKNLPAAFEIIARTAKSVPGLRWVLVSTEYDPVNHTVGSRLNELAFDMGIIDRFTLFSKGMPADRLKLLYQVADAFLLTSKAEGLGLPILEAMASNLPVVGTNTGAITELLSEGRGSLVRPIYSITDVWMNSRRDFIDIVEASDILTKVLLHIPVRETVGFTDSLRGKSSALMLKAVEEV